MLPGNAEVVLEVDLRSTADAPARARHAVRRVVAGLALDLAAIDLVVSEAVTNVVVHAYRDRADGHGRVRVAVARATDQIFVLVADDGIGMAPRSDSPGMGLGLPLIARLADSLQVRQSHEGTQLLVSFRPFASPPAPGLS